MANSFPVEVGPEWSLETIYYAIWKRTHSSTLSPESMAFFKKDILECTQWGFSISLSVIKDIALFGTTLCISRLASVYQVNRKPRLICNYIDDPDAATPLVKASTDKVTDPKVIKFDACLANAFHWCNLRPSDVGKFTYVVVPLL